MVSIINALAPLPLKGFINAVGNASTKRVSKPSNPIKNAICSITNSITPLALNIAMATNIASKNGIIETATSNPCLAPSTNCSYVFCPLRQPIINTATIKVMRAKLAIKLD